MFLVSNSEIIDHLDLPVTPNDCKHVFHLYTVKSEKRDQIANKFEQTGIGFGIHYPLPIHLQPFYRGIQGSVSLKNSEEVARRAISIPVRPDLTRNEQEKIVSVLKCLGG